MPPKIQGEDLVTLTEIIEANNDATLEELCKLLDEKTGLQVSRSTLGRISQKLDYTFKKKLSIISALSLQKVVASRNIYGSVDGVTFEAFIVKELVPQLWENACVIMDNASIHLGEMVKKAIEKVGTKVIYLSPYSPEFSPIENLALPYLW